ncbi:YobI family P-loop NTPase, partial [Mariniphaga sediminis]|uniref:YobI family P-loop NTPase n=1 Tax=Mariniphaga sediminis TaxID=1628158 RepID=UPI00356520F9
LINNSPKVAQVVKFIYAIRDEVFTNNLGRTKFFDFIIPIVPVINTTNSGDILRDYLKNDKTIPDAFINDISLYIHDLRLLKNIVNEYRIYNGVINEHCKKRSVSLFSIILYKNLFPAEFGLEHSEKGLLYKIFKETKKLILENLISENRVAVEKLNNKKSTIVSASDITEDNLRQEYILEILKTYDSVVSISNHSISAILSNRDNFKDLLTNPQIRKYDYGYNRVQPVNIKFEDIQKKVYPDLTYEARLELIKQKEEGKFIELESQIAKINSELAELQRKKLFGLIKQYQDNSWKNILFENKKNGLSSEDELIALLIRKGYIDENYQLYMSYFYEGALSLGDFKFLINVKNSEGDNFNAELTNINELFSRISVDEYEYEATLNKELIYHLLKRANYKEDKRLELLLMQFMYLEETFEKYLLPLIERLKNHKKELQRFIELLVEKYYPIIWQAVEEKNYDDKTKDEFLKLFLFLPEDKIIALNESSGNQSLKNYLSLKENFIEAFNSPEELGNITKLIKALNIKFQKLKFNRYENNQVFNYIYQNDNYILNEEMLYLMLFSKYNISESEYNKLFYEQNYTSIIESTDDALNSYIFSNYDIYLNDIYLKLEAKQAESENAISSFVDILGDEEDAETLYSILNKVSTQITDIAEFGKNEKWSLFFDTDCVVPTWKNLLSYFKSNEATLNETLTSWLNSKNIFENLTKNNLTKDNITDGDSNIVFSLMQQIIENDKLEHSAYERLVISFPYIFPQITLDKLSVDKISRLIELKKIRYNPPHYTLILSMELPNELFLFTTNNISTFIRDYNDYEFDLELHNSLLETSEVDIINKKSIIKLISIENINDSKLSSLIGTILFNTKEELVEKDKIIKVICKCVNFNLKLKLFNKSLDKFEFDEIDKILENIGGVYKQASKPRKRPTWEKNTINQSIAQKLKNIGYFHSYDIEEKKDEIKIVVRYS